VNRPSKFSGCYHRSPAQVFLGVLTPTVPQGVDMEPSIEVRHPYKSWASTAQKDSFKVLHISIPLLPALRMSGSTSGSLHRHTCANSDLESNLHGDALSLRNGSRSQDALNTKSLWCHGCPVTQQTAYRVLLS
jgi:hypothetical protein